jgi:hypothetical protein
VDCVEVMPLVLQCDRECHAASCSATLRAAWDLPAFVIPRTRGLPALRVGGPDHRSPVFNDGQGDGRTAASRADRDPILLRGEMALELAHGGMARVELAHAVWLLSSWREEASMSA